MTDRRIVITGIGVISPLGNDLASTWEAMKAGRSGIDTIKSMDVSDYSTKIAGEVKDFDPTPYFRTPKDARRVDRFTHFAMGAAGMALKDSGMDLEAVDKTRIGVMVGSGIGGLGTLETQHATLLSKGPARVSPFMIPYMISNIASGLISMEYGFGGPNMSIVTACATSNHNIGEAWRIMKFGDADVMVCGGAEATILPTGVAGFSNMKALSSRNDEPQRASRPYDVDRDGFVMGEGAGVVILETLIGILLGGLAGYFGKWVDNLIMRIVDVFYCIPSMPVIIILGAAMDASRVDPTVRMIYLMLILGFLGWAGIARLVRGQILSLREQEYMAAAEACGLSVSRRIFKHLIPNVVPQLIVTCTLSLIHI